ncbi:alpha/beta hydrolase [Streptomyces longispororuber]|uniref:alpha/beta hydrolase n=1 Tax=Streptomyces longispororuber TaxID=68230 RepID=UPI00210C8B67|nr:alpha/beta fold hydrolase [Streptomyces longispororuber]MCQ4205629.1 alpha/beta fold hydrolase [Streptomyces longispororuber]
MTGHEQRARVGGSGADGALILRRTPPEARAAVLFLHGGRADGRSPSRPWHLAALRMKPFVRAVAAALPDDDVLLATVRYRVRGWNGDAADALHDARRALDGLAWIAGDVPVVLVGHSMGGRAALRAAAAPQVRAVLALAPWCPEGEPVAHLAGKDVVVLHGDDDRVTDAQASVAFVRRARDAGAQADVSLVPGGDHAMLRDSARWHRTAASTVAGLLRR